MRNIVYNKFETNDNSWNECIFYTIYLNEENEKYIYIRGLTGRINFNNSYNGWGFKNLKYYNIKEKLSNLLEWGDITYGLSIFKKNHNINRMLYDFDCEYDDIFSCPENAYDFANKMVKGIDGKGSKKLHMVEIKETTPCGNYFGIGVI